MQEKTRTGAQLLFLGMGFYWAWIALVFYSDTLFSGFAEADELVNTFWLWATWSHTFALALHAALSGRMPRLQRFRFFGIASAFGMTAGCALPVALSLVGGESFAIPPLLIAAAIIVGLSSCWHVLLWGESFANANMDNTMALGAFATLAGLALYLVSCLVPSPIRAATTIALPILSLLCMREAASPDEGISLPPNQLHATTRQNESARSNELGKNSSSGWTILVASLFVLALGGEMLRVFSMELSFDTVNQTGLLYFVGGAVGLFALSARLEHSRKRGYGTIARSTIWVVLILMSAAFLVAPFLSGYSFAICYGVFGAGFWCFRAISWSFAVLAIQKLHVAPTRAIGVLDASFGLSVVVSGQVSFWIAESILGGAAEISTVSLIVVFALMLLSIVMLNGKKASTLLDAVFTPTGNECDEHASQGGKENGSDGENTGSASDAQGDMPKDADDPLPMDAASRYHLTPRECEVAALLARGRSLPFVQKELFISAGTAQTHVRHIYKKMNVHTRQEFLDALEDGKRH